MSCVGRIPGVTILDHSPRLMSQQPDQGRLVCACFGVGFNTIVDTITSRQLTTAQQIGEVLQAGTNCGSCVPELKQILHEAQKNLPAKTST